MKACSKCVFFAVSLALTFCFVSTSKAIIVETVPVGNIGNVADSTGFGAVSYHYRIGKTEVTNSQYAGFLNAVAASDPYSLYHSFMGISRSGSSGSYTYSVLPDNVGNGPGGSDYGYGDKPVTNVSWYDATRFTNWLHNGQGNGDTETGAYTLLGGTAIPSNGLSVTRNPGSDWFLPSEDEWYKAAYHKNDGNTGNYWTNPTSTSFGLNNNLPSADSGDSANFKDGSTTTGVPGFPLTDAGAYTLSDSPYGTFDQGGNVWEWNDTLFNPTSRSWRGGAFDQGAGALSSSGRTGSFLTDQQRVLGFRVASVPEPSLLSIWALISVGTMLQRRR